MRHPQLSPPGRQQRGFVLVVCLIFLLVLTVLGINNMGTSSLQARMASNAQSKLIAFQAADSAIEATFTGSNDVFNAIVLNAQPATPVTSNYSINSNTVATNSYVVNFNSGGTNYGNSLTQFSGALVEISSTATNPNSNAKSVLVQGVTRNIPNQ